MKMSRQILLTPGKHAWSVNGAFNPAVIRKDGSIYLFYRAVDEHMVSRIGLCRLNDKNEIIEDMPEPILAPVESYELQGVEDPRITFLEGKYYLSYTGYDGLNALGCMAVSQDLIHFERMGVVTPQVNYNEVVNLFLPNQKLLSRYAFFLHVMGTHNYESSLLWDKDIVLFPRKIGGVYVMYHRVLPGIQAVYFSDFDQLKSADFWRRYLENMVDFIVLESRPGFENAYVGSGCPPIEIDEGWLIIFHAVRAKDGKRIYQAAAALVDKENPSRVIGRWDKPLFEPETGWEKEGEVNNVVFPTGALLNGDKVSIYYGAADSCVGLVEMNLADILAGMKKV